MLNSPLCRCGDFISERIMDNFKTKEYSPEEMAEFRLSGGEVIEKGGIAMALWRSCMISFICLK